MTMSVGKIKNFKKNHPNFRLFQKGGKKKNPLFTNTHTSVTKHARQ